MKTYLFLITLFFSVALSAQNTLLYSVSLDTITNTAADTIEFTPPTKNYDYVVDCHIKQAISGTDSLLVTLEESVDGTNWYLAAAANTLNTANAHDKETGTMYGRFHRLIVKGLATQSTSYVANFFYRRKD